MPKEYLHSAELRDIMQFGSSASAVFFKMRVAGVLHIFQFDTRQGEDICMALQTHINDIMMKRYSKVCFGGSWSTSVPVTRQAINGWPPGMSRTSFPRQAEAAVLFNRLDHVFHESRARYI